MTEFQYGDEVRVTWKPGIGEVTHVADGRVTVRFDGYAATYQAYELEKVR